MFNIVGPGETKLTVSLRAQQLSTYSGAYYYLIHIDSYCTAMHCTLTHTLDKTKDKIS